MEALGAFAIIVYILLFLFLIFLSVLWILLPFAVFGIKERLNKTNQLLEHISNNTAFTLHEAKKTNEILKAVHNVREN
jgi:hypothetical protein